MEVNYDSERLAGLMDYCVNLAKKSRKSVYKPYVGAVVLSGDKKIIGRGYKKKMSDTSLVLHAERVAIDDILPGEVGHTLVTTLEPCFCNGKKSNIYESCSELIVNSGIKQVIFGRYDGSGTVNSGSGADHLREHGVKVIHYKGLEDEINNELMGDFYGHKQNVRNGMSLSEACNISKENGRSVVLDSILCLTQSLYSSAFDVSEFSRSSYLIAERLNWLVVEFNKALKNSNFYVHGKVINELQYCHGDICKYVECLSVIGEDNNDFKNKRPKRSNKPSKWNNNQKRNRFRNQYTGRLSNHVKLINEVQRDLGDLIIQAQDRVVSKNDELFDGFNEVAYDIMSRIKVYKNIDPDMLVTLFSGLDNNNHNQFDLLTSDKNSSSAFRFLSVYLGSDEFLPANQVFRDLVIESYPCFYNRNVSNPSANTYFLSKTVESINFAEKFNLNVSNKEELRDLKEKVKKLWD